MDDKKLDTAIELSRKVRGLSITVAYYEKLKLHATRNTSIRIYVSSDDFALVHDGFIDSKKNESEGFNFLPFTPIQLLDMAIEGAKKLLEAAQEEYEAL